MTSPFGLTTSSADDSQANRHRTAATSSRSAFSSKANSALKVAGMSWFVVAGLGQVIFVVYLFGFYGRTALLGRFEAWNQVFPRSHVAGDVVHNSVVAMHLVQDFVGGRKRWNKSTATVVT